MSIQTLLSKHTQWLEDKGYLSEVVISSRIRLARNLKKIPFVHMANKTTLNNILSSVIKVIRKNKYLMNSIIIHLNEISPLDRLFLLERHLISKEHIQEGEEKGVIIGEGEIISIMVNEEDHLRLQCLQAGLQLIDGWRLLDEIDNELSKELEFAFSSEWGYLTACPTNTGTGLRASVLVHLPALIITEKINKILQGVTKLRIAVRGFYGEGTEVMGSFFQMSNQTTLGQTEENLIDNIEGIIKQVVEQEQRAREELLKKKRGILEDKIWRAYAILKYARSISSQETMELLSAVRLGIHLEIIKINILDLNKILISSQPAHLQKLINKEMKKEERDRERANFIRAKLES